MQDIVYSIHKLTKTFDDSVCVLDDISLDIYKGEVFGIIGLSGAGKSTLIRCMNMLEIPTSGKILFDNSDSDISSDNNSIGNMVSNSASRLVDITKASPQELNNIRQKVGFVFQGFNLFNQRNVLKNVLFPLEIAHNKTQDNIRYANKLLEIVGLSSKVKAYPSSLSGGQKQRVAIARALAGRPKVLLCDEPTSALDPETTRELLVLLKDINKTLGVSIVIITHEMSVVERICDRVAILDKGKIVESGHIKDIFATPKTDIAKSLVLFSQGDNHCIEDGSVRIVFDGNEREPIISNLVLHLGTPINILFASTKEIEGRTYGQMVVKLPSDKQMYDKATEYISERGLRWEVVHGIKSDI